MKQIRDAKVGNRKGALHVSPDDKRAEHPRRDIQMGSSPAAGKGTFFGGSYIGKRRVAEHKVSTPMYDHKMAKTVKNQGSASIDRG